ncbi:MAG: hypothetical protein CMF12_03930 [Idiomarina sp.]|nr:hypothetical protein [Idiomarina sp.]
MGDYADIVPGWNARRQLRWLAGRHVLRRALLGAGSARLLGGASPLDVKTQVAPLARRAFLRRRRKLRLLQQAPIGAPSKASRSECRQAKRGEARAAWQAAAGRA